MVIKCPECQNEVNENESSCSNCGYPLNITTDSIKNTRKVQDSNLKYGLFAVLAALSFLISSIFYYKGYDKLTKYYSSETYSSLSKNAYVGGDAYNYIINGTYSTSFFVLGVGFMIAGLILIVIYYVAKTKN